MAKLIVASMSVFVPKPVVYNGHNGMESLV